MDKITIIIVAIVILISAGFWAWQSGFFTNTFRQVPIPEGIILFYREDCPHCKNVEDFLTQNNIKDKVEITRLEVLKSADNQNILTQVVKKCKLNLREVGVPFLWDGQNCLMGDTDIIKFFSKYITSNEEAK